MLGNLNPNDGGGLNEKLLTEELLALLKSLPLEDQLKIEVRKQRVKNLKRDNIFPILREAMEEKDRATRDKYKDLIKGSKIKEEMSLSKEFSTISLFYQLRDARPELLADFCAYFWSHAAYIKTIKFQ